MSTGFMKIAAVALPVLLVAACAGDDTDDANGTDAALPAPTDTAMYTAPPPPPVTDTMGMMGDTMRHDTMGADTTRM